MAVTETAPRMGRCRACGETIDRCECDDALAELARRAMRVGLVTQTRDDGSIELLDGKTGAVVAAVSPRHPAPIGGLLTVVKAYEKRAVPSFGATAAAVLSRSTRRSGLASDPQNGDGAEAYAAHCDGDGVKHDAWKLRMDLIPPIALRQLAAVLSYGSEKYSDDNWKRHRLDDGIRRHYAALLRHLTAWRDGEEYDAESGLHHLAHAIANVAFVMWAENEKLRAIGRPMTETWRKPPSEDGTEPW